MSQDADDQAMVDPDKYAAVADNFVYVHRALRRDLERIIAGGEELFATDFPRFARILEKHFTSDKSWPGPDVPISLDPKELGELVEGSKAVFEALGGGKTILEEEQPTIDFAYACVVSIRDIKEGEALSKDNIWVKRPGTGEIKAKHFEELIGQTVTRAIKKNEQLSWGDVDRA